MNIISEFLIYVIEQRNEIFTLLFQHIRLTVFSVIFSIMLGVPLGILIKYVKKLNKPILGFANIVQAIPSMALLGISIPILGIGLYLFKDGPVATITIALLLYLFL